MSRTVKKTIAFGRSTKGGSNRTKKTWTDFANEKAQKAGKPIHKQHHRHNLQTLEDYIAWVESGFHIYNDSSHPSYCSQELKKYEGWLNGRKETPALIREYAKILFNKDKSK